MARANAKDMRRRNDDPVNTLAIDIGGTGLKAAVLDPAGKMVGERVRVPTPHPCPPALLVSTLEQMVAALPPFDRISVGFPGVIRHGVVLTAVNLDNEGFRGFPLEKTLAERLRKPTRVLNDAEVQGLGIIEGKRLEVVITLGTGVGSAIFIEGRLTPHLELAHHPLKGHKTYEEYLGNAARKAVGRKRWNKRVRYMIEVVRTLTNFDRLYLGGGNAAIVEQPLPANVVLADNVAGITGGIRLWDDRVWSAVQIVD